MKSSRRKDQFSKAGMAQKISIKSIIKPELPKEAKQRSACQRRS